MNRVLSICALCLCAGCQLLTPPDPPLEDPILRPDAYAWLEFDITQEYEYIDVPRIDCGKVESLLSGSGRCVPVHKSFGKIYECPLEAPASKFYFACFSDEELPAVYARFEFAADVDSVDFTEHLGNCQVVGAGPAAGQPPRYPTDIGFKACLFTNFATPGKLIDIVNTQIPAGVFIDLSDNPESVDELNEQVSAHVFNAPLALVMDARLLSADERIQAFKDLTLFFQPYRSLNPELHIKQPEAESK